MTREEWLNKVAERMAPWYADLGSPLPAFRVSIGFPSQGKRGKTIGQCWDGVASKDKHCEIFLRPDLDDPMVLAATLAHELIHAAIGCQAKHGKAFKRIAVAIGLEGKMTATTASPDFLVAVEPILAAVGPVPHGRLNFASAVTSGPPKQGTRMIKVECSDCGYTVRTTRKWLDIGAPRCPLHGDMTPESED